jgi:N-acetylglutamate synthase-like GNAT family acetyltransferase
MIRRAHLEDVPVCAEIVAQWEAQTDYMPRSTHACDLAQFITEAFDEREIWVIGAPIQGYMSIDPAQQKIGALYVRNQGLGKGKSLIDHAKKERDFLWLTVYLPNTRAQAFYRREGFVQTAQMPSDTAGEPDIYRMQWHREDAA